MEAKELNNAICQDNVTTNLIHTTIYKNNNECIVNNAEYSMPSEIQQHAQYLLNQYYGQGVQNE